MKFVRIPVGTASPSARDGAIGDHPRPGAQTALTALWAVLLSTLTWRVRTSTALAENPFDLAGVLRIGLDGVALAMALLSLQSIGHRRRMPASWWLYVAYVAVVVLGLTTAVSPALVAFRATELTVFLVVAYACYRNLTADRMIATVERFCWILAGTVIIGAVVMPATALVPAKGGIVPFRVEGIVPTLSANSVGLIGCLLLAIGLGGRSIRRGAVPVGLALVLLSQYRTGYLAVLCILVVWLVRRRRLASWYILLSALPVTYWLVRTAAVQDAWVRGEGASKSTQTLSGRTLWWGQAIEVADRSRWIGTGLSSGTRYEVFGDRLGGGGTVSTIHSAWIEAYIGAGFLGATLLGLCVVFAAVQTWRASRGSAVPLLLLVTLLVRSLTGTTFELPDLPLAVFLVAMVASARLAVDGAVEDAGPAGVDPPPGPASERPDRALSGSAAGDEGRGGP